jgi:hypothetical protein
MTHFKLKHDKFKKSRGGPSRLLNLSCTKCQAHLLTYQKDVVVSLKRLYLDRIFEPEYLKNQSSNLVCSSCQTVIGTLYIYEKENRLAYLLKQGSFTKKINK